MCRRLEGKVALITGGARGMGASEARLFAKEGAKVVIGDVLEEEGRRVEAEVNQSGGECLFIKLDVSREEEWRRAVQAVLSRFGKLDILVNNAGILIRVPLEETTNEVWSHVLDVNAKGVFLGMKWVIPEMRKSGAGSIVNISSSGVLSGASPPSYAASKGAVRALSLTAAVDHGKDGIRVNCIFPGLVETEMTRTALSAPGMKELRNRETPLGRIGTPEDIARAVLFLASDEASFITGAELAVDGGWTVR